MPKTLVNIREDILMVTRKLLAEEGYGKLNVRTIAAKCGIAAGTLYNYYNSKQEIVEEILKTEWSMMNRRIEQGIKAEITLIEKLGIFYRELGFLMDNVHNVWLQNSDISFDKDELSNIKCHKEILLKSLSDKIYVLIIDKDKNKDYEFLSDVISRLFVLYAYQGNVEYRKLSPVIESLLL